jgi:hypothetical protein
MFDCLLINDTGCDKLGVAVQDLKTFCLSSSRPFYVLCGEQGWCRGVEVDIDIEVN